MNTFKVTYIGNGVWKDNKGVLWCNNPKLVSNPGIVVASKEFETDMSEAEFRQSRPDLDFMINYGQMKIEQLGGITKDDNTGDGGITPTSVEDNTDNENTTLAGSTVIISGGTPIISSISVK